MAAHAKTLYDLLRVSPSVSPAELRLAYRRRMLEVHPDKGGTVELCQQVIAAFEQLDNFKSRCAYDLRLAQQTGVQQNLAAKKSTQKCKHDSFHKTTQHDAKRKYAVDLSPINSDGNLNHKRKCKRSNPALLVAQNTSRRGSAPEDTQGERGHSNRQQRQADLIARIVSLLQSLSREQRCDFIKEKLTVPQRREMESFMRSHHHVVAIQVHASQEAQCSGASVSDSGESTFHDTSPYPLESDSMKTLALGDVGDIDRAQRGAHCPNSECLTDANCIEGGLEPSCLSEIGAQVARCGRLRGITRDLRSDRRPLYTAQVTFCWFSFRGRQRVNLAQAIDDHVILVAIKSRALGGADVDGNISGKQVHDIINEVLDEHNIALEEFGLNVHFSIPAYHWLGKCLRSPYYSFRDLDVALTYWQMCREARGQHGVGGAGLLFRVCPAQASDIWKNTRKVYLELWAARGADLKKIMAHLSHLESAHAHHRQSNMEWWERNRMARQERLQRDVAKLEARMRRQQQRLERWERTRMQTEDRHKPKQSLEEKFERIKQRLNKLLKRWNAKQMQAHLAVERERARHMRESQRLAQDKQREFAAVLRKKQVERKTRWRLMQRKDLTMADILERRYAAP